MSFLPRFTPQPAHRLFDTEHMQTGKKGAGMVQTIGALAMAVMLALAGCQAADSSSASAAESSAQVTARVLEMASRGQSQESLRIGEAFLLKNADAQGDLRRALAQLYTENGDTQSALRHLEALAGAVGAAHPGPQGPAAPDKPDLPNISAEAQGASAQVSNRASQAQAGDVSASTGR